MFKFYSGNKKNKKGYTDVKKMGVNIDKNEYYTIKDSHENYPEQYYKK